MSTRHKNKSRMGGKTRKRRNGKKMKVGKRWTSAISAASRTLAKTQSLTAARESLRRQALLNARKLFGSVGM